MRDRFGRTVARVGASTIAVLFCLGCGTTGGAPKAGGAGESQPVTKTVDGLVRVETDSPGILFLRPDHGIGGYDAIAIAPSFVNYRRRSARLDPADEEVYLVSLEQAILDAAEEANVPVVDEVGDCVIKVGAGFVNVELARSSKADVLGQMTLVIEYRDSMSDQSLLRYAAQEQIEREADGTSRQEQIARSFDRMIEDIDIITALRKATAVPSEPRPGCEGKLIHAGQSAGSESSE
ncbi:MAG TPA: hypothetical protein ENI85_04565 [Deltaproteobacteria bacterium]|nr:hypothetical protein [Deltaproteobacteria bacterium]